MLSRNQTIRDDRLKEVFEAMDEDNKGYVTLENLEHIMGSKVHAEEVMSEVRADEDLKAQGPQALNQAVSSRYMERANKLRAEILKKHDMSQDDLQASVVKYQTEPKLQQLISRLTFDQQQRFKKLSSNIVCFFF